MSANFVNFVTENCMQNVKNVCENLEFENDGEKLTLVTPVTGVGR